MNIILEMWSKKFVFLVNLFLLNLVYGQGHLDLQWETRNPAFDPKIYEDALDPESCADQLEYITRNNTMLRLQFLDAGVRFPRGFFIGNTLDLGNYHQCLGINQDAQNMVIQGKYCLIQGPLNQNLKGIAKLSHLNPEEVEISDEMLKNLKLYSDRKSAFDVLTGGAGDARIPGTPFATTVLRLAVCIPKPCTTDEGISGLLANVSALGLQFQEEFCRLPDDKPWAPVDYVTIALFSCIGLLTILSTGYDLHHTFRLKKDPKSANTIWQSFSLYTNTRRLLTFSSSPGTLECVDGVRALAMAWVIIGHTFTSHSHWSNPFDTFVFTAEFSSLWITAAHLTVDTFLFLSGLLVVYTTAGKLTGIKLLKNLHLFYLNRLLRMFPILAAGILLEASIAHRISDGPDWRTVANLADRCRTMWWTTLLHVQNYVSPRSVCIGQTWYLAIDVQLHIISPIVLVWVLGSKRRTAWVALVSGLLASVIAATIYNFIMEFPSGMMTPARRHELMYYMVYYYMNTLPRSSTFFVGMVFGYLLYTWRGKKVQIPKFVVALLWICFFGLSSTTIYATYPPLQVEWDNQLGDTMINSFQRPAWGLALGWLIFACMHGYGGPINWFLSLRMWKLPARISYAMYIVHWSLMSIISGSRVAPLFFTVPTVFYNFMGQFALTFIVSFVITVIIDSPCSTLFKLLLGGGSKKHKNEEVVETEEMKDGGPTARNGTTNEGYNDDEMKLKEK